MNRQHPLKREGSENQRIDRSLTYKSFIQYKRTLYASTYYQIYSSIQSGPWSSKCSSIRLFLLCITYCTRIMLRIMEIIVILLDDDRLQKERKTKNKGIKRKKGRQRKKKCSRNWSRAFWVYSRTVHSYYWFRYSQHDQFKSTVRLSVAKLISKMEETVIATELKRSR